MTETVDPRLNMIRDCLYRLSAKAIVVRDGKMLVVQETGGWWSLPGGGVDHGEDMDVAIAREMAEEVGIRAADIEISPEVFCIANHEIHVGIPRIQVFYRVTLRSTAHIQKEELVYKWVTATELKDLSVSPAIQEIREKLLNLLAN